ncbi:GPP34 family phosphoprotein [Arthrobacter sp. HMWF013]|nr:GPP34 family phosphoprotein [Arthrobacter sp. HMWF013]
MDAEMPKADELNLPQALLLLATTDHDGRSAVPHAVLTAALSGAILAELELLGAIELHGKHVRATGTSPQTDFGNQLELIRDGSRPHTPKRWVSMLESRAELRRVYEGLASLGIVDQVGERRLGLFRRTRYPEKDHAPEAALLEKVGAALSGGSADPRTRALTSLLYSAELIGKIFPGIDQGHARELAHNYWPSRAVAAELRMIRLAEAETAS